MNEPEGSLEDLVSRQVKAVEDTHETIALDYNVKSETKAKAKVSKMLLSNLVGNPPTGEKVFLRGICVVFIEPKNSLGVI